MTNPTDLYDALKRRHLIALEERDDATETRLVLTGELPTVLLNDRGEILIVDGSDSEWLTLRDLSIDQVLDRISR
jgi:hypothetical protein